jgi:hypothetical protein
MAAAHLRINGKTSPFVKRKWLACVVCNEVVSRRSNSQKYCDDCRRLATSRTVAKYYKRHRRQILKQKRQYREEHRDERNAKQRAYHQETKNERLSRSELHGVG